MYTLSWPMADWPMDVWRMPSEWTLGGRGGIWLPGTAAGERGPEREGVTLAGEPTGEGDGPRMPGKWGEV